MENESDRPTAFESAPPKQPELLAGDVHVWCASLEVADAKRHQLHETLSSDEQSRAQRLYFQRDRDRFIVNRGLLRAILSRYVDIAPKDLRFEYASSGKPALVAEQGGDTFRFNVSHSHTLALYAVTLDRDVGIDVEHIRGNFDWQAIAERFFSPNENAVLQTLPIEIRQQSFFLGWTRKEAYIKATGRGLSIPLDQFEVSLAPGEPAALLNTQWNPEDSDRWFLYDLTPSPGYVAALAVAGACSQLHCWHLPCDLE